MSQDRPSIEVDAMASPSAANPSMPASTNTKPSPQPPQPQPPASHPAFLVRVRSPDGATEAAIPIWIPLSIMAGAAAQDAAYFDPGTGRELAEEAAAKVARAASEAVIVHGRDVEGRCRDDGDCVDPNEVMGHVHAAARRACCALLKAGGNVHGAAAVEAAVRGGGARLLPALKARSTIRLTGDGGAMLEPPVESREEMETGGDMEHDEGEGRGAASKSVLEKTWLKNVMPAPVQYENQKKEVSRRNNRAGRGATRSSKRESRKGNNHPSPASDCDSSSRDDSASCGSESTEGVVHNLSAEEILDQGLDLAAEGIDRADRTLRTEMYRPDNLLPQWEQRAADDSVAERTERTVESGFFASTLGRGLMNLFFPVPGIRRHDESSTIVSSTLGDADEAQDQGLAAEKTWDADSVAKDVEDGTLDPIINARSDVSSKEEATPIQRNLQLGSDNGAGAKLKRQSAPRPQTKRRSSWLRRAAQAESGPSPDEQSQRSLSTHVLLSQHAEKGCGMRNIEECYLPRPDCLITAEAYWNRCLVESARMFMQQRNDAITMESESKGDATPVMLDKIEAELKSVQSDDNSLAETSNPTVPTSIPILHSAESKRKSVFTRLKTVAGKIKCKRREQEEVARRELEYWQHQDGSIAILKVEDSHNKVEDEISLLKSLNNDGTYEDELTVT